MTRPSGGSAESPSPAPIPADIIEGLQVCPGNPDAFTFSVSAGQVISLLVTWRGALGALESLQHFAGHTGETTLRVAVHRDGLGGVHHEEGGQHGGQQDERPDRGTRGEELGGVSHDAMARPGGRRARISDWLQSTTYICNIW